MVRILRGCLLGAVAALVLTGMGCSTIREEQKPLTDTTLIVTRAGEDMTLSWASQAGVDYILWYTNRRDAQARWQIMPGAERLHGNGQNMTWRDRVPTGQSRYYRLQALPPSARSP